MNTAVRAGYKLTEVGVIPEDWDISPIGDIFTVTAGGDFDSCCSSLVQDERFLCPIYSIALSSQGLYGYCEYAEHAANSITVTARGLVGSASFRNHKYTAIGRVLVLRPHEESDGRFFAEFINERIAFAVESTGVPQLTAPQISSYKLLVPPLPEQRAIATALSDVDALLIKLDQLIAKKRDIKQAAMQQLLTGQTRLPGFSGAWEVKRLGDVAAIDPENLDSNTAANYEFNYISLEDIDHGILCGFSEEVFFSAPSRARRKLRNGDILISTVRPSLQSHLHFKINAPNWVCSTGFAVVRCRTGVSESVYVFQHLFAESVSRQIETLLTGSNYPAINSGDVRALEIPIPSIPEQSAIATILSDMDTELAALQTRRDKTQALKQGMMQELLTGNIRLP